jgi:hypothetical protein
MKKYFLQPNNEFKRNSQKCDDTQTMELGRVSVLGISADSKTLFTVLALLLKRK